MKEALSLARQGAGKVSPNPMVGALVVKGGKVVGKGYHERFGAPHAEAVALAEAGSRARGGTLYVNLEPCTHSGKTPPCVDEIISNGIESVVVAIKDPNPVNNGKGLKTLEKAGISIITGVLAEEALRLNEAFIKYITTGLPLVSIKIAQSLDGKIATKYGESRWITGARARERVHNLRAFSDCVMVGINTVLKDDPLLTARPKNKMSFKEPLRVVLDAHLRMPRTANVVLKGESPTLIATTRDIPAGKVAWFKKNGVEVLPLLPKGEGVSLKSLLRELALRGIASVLVEGGGETIASFVEERLVDKIYYFIAPKIIGGRDAPTSCDGKGAGALSQALALHNISVEKVGDDILITGYTAA